MIAAHPHEAFRNFDFVTYFKFHISYNMRLCLGPFLWNGLLAESSVLLFLGNDILNSTNRETIAPIAVALRIDIPTIEAQVVPVGTIVPRR